MLIASSALLAALVYYAALCAIRPFAPCRKCRGLGRTERFGKPRMCPRCHNDKLRLRLGRRAFNAWQRTREAGTRPTPAPFKESH
ncbi:hypothetical protein ACTU45_29835 [Streptomyces sp. 24-1644]|uniref:hypothetical protein n=1 Tax=Streptomyces sp. 24-1644 TaxID=3457315 RepID=UPI003FA7B494